MIKYTPKKALLRELDVSKVGYWWETQRIVVSDILKRYKLDTNYSMAHILLSKYPKYCFYSETPLRLVPIEGYLFPVAMFNEEKA